MKRNLLIASGMAGLMAFAATRLPAADEDALILQGTAGTTLCLLYTSPSPRDS